MIDKYTFQTLAKQGYNRIPLVKEILADLDTPLSVYLKLADQPWTYLLESVQGGEKWGRYSFIGLPCSSRIEVRGEQFAVINHQGVVHSEITQDPLAAIEAWHSQIKVAPTPATTCLPRFAGGLVGYFGYDTIRYIEPTLGACRNSDPLNVPDILLMVSDAVVVFDTLAGKLFVTLLADPNQEDSYCQAKIQLNKIVEQLQDCSYQALRDNWKKYEPLLDTPLPKLITEDDFISGFTRAGFEAAVERVQENIAQGECEQVVLSQRMSIAYRSSPLELYRALRFTNPSPYMYYLNVGDHAIVGSSPEILVRSEDGIATLRPIAGTRKRGVTPEQDQELELELLADPKEVAEHRMLIDLGCSDLARIAKPGSVKVTEEMAIERYSHVMHIVSNIIAEQAEDATPISVLKATFPAGTLTGAPKVRAMEIIDELEPVKRGIYGGAVGYISWSGNMDMAIAIRTAVIKDSELHIQAGAGVVAESVPFLEWQETLNKGRAIFSAVARVEHGLDSESSRDAKTLL